jgi:hypothetical protein
MAISYVLALVFIFLGVDFNSLWHHAYVDSSNLQKQNVPHQPFDSPQESDSASDEKDLKDSFEDEWGKELWL